MVSIISRPRFASRRKPDEVIPPPGKAISAATSSRSGVSGPTFFKSNADTRARGTFKNPYARGACGPGEIALVRVGAGAAVAREMLIPGSGSGPAGNNTVASRKVKAKLRNSLEKSKR